MAFAVKSLVVWLLFCFIVELLRFWLCWEAA